MFIVIFILPSALLKYIFILPSALLTMCTPQHQQAKWIFIWSMTHKLLDERACSRRARKIKNFWKPSSLVVMHGQHAIRRANLHDIMQIVWQVLSCNSPLRNWGILGFLKVWKKHLRLRWFHKIKNKEETRKK